MLTQQEKREGTQSLPVLTTLFTSFLHLRAGEHLRDNTHRLPDEQPHRLKTRKLAPIGHLLS